MTKDRADMVPPVAIGVECSAWNYEREIFCGAPATWYQAGSDGCSVVGLHCDGHRDPADRRIPDDWPRAKRSIVIRRARYLVT